MDVNSIPRRNFSSIFDFENSYVKALYRAQPTWVAGVFVVAGYLIITLLDIIYLCWYIILAPIVIYSFFYGVPVFVKTLWSYLSGFFNGVLHIAEATGVYIPSSASVKTPPAKTSSTKRSPIKAFPAKNSPVKAPPTNKLSSDTTHVETAPEPATAAYPAKQNPLKSGDPKNSLPTMSSPLRFFPSRESPYTTSFVKSIPNPSTEAAPAKTSSTKPSRIEPGSGKSKGDIFVTTTEAALQKTFPAHRYPTRTSTVKENHFASPANPSPIELAFGITHDNSSANNTGVALKKIVPVKRYPTRTSPVKESHTGRAPSNMVPAQLGKKDENSETINWLWEVPKLLFSTLYNHLNKLYILALALVCVALLYYCYSALPSLPNSLQVRQGLLLSNGAGRIFGIFKKSLWSPFTTTSNFLIPLATRTNAIFFIVLIPVVTLLSSLPVGVGAFLGFATIAGFYQTSWTTSSAIFLVVLGCTIVYGFRKAWPALFFLILPSLVCWANTQCFNAAAISVSALVFFAISAWATQIFIGFMKRISPGLIGLPFSILTWQPVFWGTMFWIGRYQNFFPYSPIEQMRQYWNKNVYIFLFLFLAIFKGTKIVVHTISYYLYTRPIQPPQNPTITPADVTVVVPTVGTFGFEFEACVRSIIKTKPARVIVSTVGHARHIEGIRTCQAISPRIEVISIPEPNKRAQLIAAIEMVRTPIIIFADDSAFWPRTFLRSALAPFEDPIVGLVGTSKRVIRDRSYSFVNSFFNYLACIYLERHNFECTASYNIDGGVFVILGRTVLARTSILHSVEYREKFQNERFCGIGPMKVDDDNFNTRFMVNHGFKTVFQNDPSATIVTTMGHGVCNLTKFKGQLMRWARTTWRSNLTSLLVDRNCYQRHPWTTYAMFASSLANFAFFYDFGMFYLLWKSGSSHMCAFVMILLLTKIIKPLPHLVREWRDWYFVPFGILFGWYHSFIKLWACLTMWDVQWSGRSGIKATA